MGIPVREEDRDLLRGLALNQSLARLECMCAESTVSNATKAGDFPAAKAALLNSLKCDEARDLAHSRLWDAIYHRYPETKNGNWSLDKSSWELKPDIGETPGGLLASLLKKAAA